MDSDYWRNFWTTRASRRTVLRTGLVAGGGVAAAAIGAACGGGGGGGEETTGGGVAGRPTVPPNAPDVTDSPFGVPKGARWGGKYRDHNSDDAYSLDPHTQNTPGSQRWGKPAYNGLLIPWENTPGEQVLMGDLVEKWEQPSDTEYVFTLRQGVKFHNVPPVNGRLFTAEDVKYNLERMGTNDPQYYLRPMIEPIDRITAVDDRTVKVTTKEPYAGLLLNLGHTWASMVAREVVEAGDIATKAIGTGPFIFQGWDRGVGVRHKRNPDYFKPGQPFIDAVELLYVPDSATREAQILTGEVDGSSINLTLKSKDVVDKLKNQLLSAFPGTEFLEFNASYSVYLASYANLAHPPFNDDRVRKALYRLIKFDELIKLWGGYAMRTGPLPPLRTKWALDQSELPTYDPAEGKKLLEAAGLSGGLSTEIWGCTEYNTHVLAPILGDFWKDADVQAKYHPLEAAACVQAIYHYAEDYPLTAHAEWVYDDPDYALYSVFHSKGANQHQGLDLGPGGKPFYPELDSLLEKQRRTMDEAERIKVVKEIQRLLVNEAIRFFMVSYGSVIGIRPWLKNFHVHLGGNATAYRNLDTFYITESSPRANA